MTGTGRLFQNGRAGEDTCSNPRGRKEMLMTRKQLTKWASRSAAALLAGAMVFGGAAMAAPVQTWAADSSIVDGETKTGSLTITKKAAGDQGEVLEGAGYTLYKVMSLTPGEQAGDYARYEAAPEFANVLKGVKPDSLGNYSSQQLENLIDQLKAEIDKGTISAAAGEKKTDMSGVVTFSGLELGYYLVVESTAPTEYVAGRSFLIAIPSTDNYADGLGGTEGTQWVYHVAAEPKNAKVTIDKQLAGTEDQAEQDGSVGVGDFVKYQVNTIIPAYTEEYFAKNVSFVISDTMSDGLEIQDTKEHPIEVQVGSQKVERGDGTYTAEASNKSGENPDLTITFAQDYIKAHGGEKAEITYYAKVTEQAVTGTAGNPNQVTLTYNNKPGETTKAESNEVKVYSFNIKVVKFTKEEGSKALQGAEFSLYSDKECKTQIGGSQSSGVDGTLSFGKLDAGVYYLKETKSPAGYTLLTNPIKVEIRAVTDSSNHAAGTFDLYVDDEKVETDRGDFVTQLDQTSGTATIAVENHKGFTLPATGGTGIALFLLIGAAGIFTVSAVLVKKSRKAAK